MSAFCVRPMAGTRKLRNTVSSFGRINGSEAGFCPGISFLFFCQFYFINAIYSSEPSKDTLMI
jgi:hypothetical protein